MFLLKSLFNKIYIVENLLLTLLIVFLGTKFDKVKTIKTATKPKELPVKQVMRKPEGRLKVKMGTMRHLIFMSDTLFDNDLKL